MRLRLSILGAGNVGGHLAKAFLTVEGVEVVQLYNRTPERLDTFRGMLPVTSRLDGLAPADVYLISVSDAAIPDVSRSLPPEALWLHTSGSTPMEVLQNVRIGVLYPLQTFSRDHQPDFSRVPFCIEARNAGDMEIIRRLASLLSEDVREMSSPRRLKLHIAAVFANNFTNYLWEIARRLGEESGMDFDILYPLLDETLAKIKRMPPDKAQTGPARRGDAVTVDKHLRLLEGTDRKIYKMLSEIIANEYGKEL